MPRLLTPTENLSGLTLVVTQLYSSRLSCSLSNLTHSSRIVIPNSAANSIGRILAPSLWWAERMEGLLESPFHLLRDLPRQKEWVCHSALVHVSLLRLCPQIICYASKSLPKIFSALPSGHSIQPVLNRWMNETEERKQRWETNNVPFRLFIKHLRYFMK